MFSLYIQPAANFLPSSKQTAEMFASEIGHNVQTDTQHGRDIIAFLYYSIVLTALTVVVAITIGVIQLLTLISNIANPKGKFWDGVETAGDYYDAIGGGICGCFVVVGILSVFLYKPWKRRMARRYGLTTDVIVADVGEGRAVIGEERGHLCDADAGKAGSLISVKPTADQDDVENQNQGQPHRHGVFLRS